MEEKKELKNGNGQHRRGWSWGLARFCMAVLLFLTVSGLAITFGPFHAAIQWSVLVHTLIGLLTLAPLVYYCWIHWVDYRRYTFSHVVLLGYVALAALLICLISGLVVTWQGLFGIRTSAVWRNIHLGSTFVILVGLVPHLVIAFARALKTETARPARVWLAHTCAGTVLGIFLIGGLTYLYSGAKYVNEFPEDYSFLYGEDRPFAPSLATTDTGGAFDARSMAGSASCGTIGCHEQILEEWQPSAHRYAAMDTVFQGIQTVMAQQNGPESTRYCGGCHDPISLFSGTKNIFVEDLTGLHGYQEGVSCIACHAIRSTDISGNADFVITQPNEYLWQWETEGLARTLRDFLIRTYPKEHNKLNKRAYKKPEYCAACHKQFIDQEINRVGWVQLQNQYDNWAVSHWNHKDDFTRTVECRECHMPLVDSRDPAAGDAYDYNRTKRDGKHRSHRFLGSNQFMPELLKLEGWEEQVRLTELWLQGKFEIPEIADKWAEGPIVKLNVHAPETVKAGEAIPLRVVLISNKVGHDFPTGPLDIIQSWVEVRVTDDSGREVFGSGRVDENNFIEPGTFLFKAEPVDQYGNLIDRHNLWEMVGVRYRRALFPGYSDVVNYLIPCSGSIPSKPEGAPEISAENQMPLEFDLETPSPRYPGSYTISVALQYRKVDQFLLNYVKGQESGITSPITELTREEVKVQVISRITPEETAALFHK
jgi:hypothetical protein